MLFWQWIITFKIMSTFKFKRKLKKVASLRNRIIKVSERKVLSLTWPKAAYLYFIAQLICQSSSTKNHKIQLVAIGIEETRRVIPRRGTMGFVGQYSLDEGIHTIGESGTVLFDRTMDETKMLEQHHFPVLIQPI